MGAGGGSKGVGDFMAGGFRNDVFGTSGQASSAQQAAMEQQSAAQRQQDLATGRADKVGANMSDLAKATPQELTAYTQSLQGAQTQLQQQQKIIDSIDPSVMEASRQVLKVLQGGQTGLGNALGSQRNAQRAQLVNSLQSQYGPGAESTSIGQRQLQAFDRDTASLGQQAQGQTLSNLMGIVQDRPNVNGALGALNASGQNFGNIQGRQIGAAQAGGQMYLGALMGTGQGVVGSAGADQTQNLINYGAQRQFFDNWSNSSMKFGQQMGGAGMGNAMGGGGGNGGNGGGGSFWQQSGSSFANGMGQSVGRDANGGGSQWQPMSAQGNSFWSQNPYAANNYRTQGI